MSSVNQNNPIILLDSDEETESSFTCKDTIYIDLSDDEPDKLKPAPTTTRDPLTAELEHIFNAPISTLLTPTKRNLLPKRDYTSVRTKPRSAIHLTAGTVRDERPIHRPDRPLSSQHILRSSLENSISRDTNYTQSSSQNRKRPADSPFNQRPEIKTSKPNKNRQQENELEEVLENFVSVISSTRFKETCNDNEEQVRCVMCRSLFPRSLIRSHNQECDSVSEVIISRKKTIADAVALDETERKRRNLGKKDDVAPTNYYGYSDDIFATDGSGFNESASDTLWEYAGQTHFG